MLTQRIVYILVLQKKYFVFFKFLETICMKFSYIVLNKIFKRFEVIN